LQAGHKDPLYDIASTPASTPGASKKAEPLYDRAGNFVYTRTGKPVMDNVGIYFDKAGNPIYDYAGNPLYNKSGKPLYDKADKFQFDKIGNPIYDRAGNPAYYKPQTPIYDKASTFLPFYDRAGNLVFDDEGKFIQPGDEDPVYDLAAADDGKKGTPARSHLEHTTDPLYDYSSPDPIYELAGNDDGASTSVDGVLLNPQIAGFSSTSDPIYDIAAQEAGSSGGEVWPVSPSVAGQVLNVGYQDGDDVWLIALLFSSSQV
jgi:hypothetical protein